MPENCEAWTQFDRLFCRFLDELGLDFEVLPCNLMKIEERVEFVMERWKFEARGKLEIQGLGVEQSPTKSLNDITTTTSQVVIKI